MLETLIRVKGIMDFGDPKSMEAIIETMRASRTANYKVGDTIESVGAVVTKIDSAVTFNYDGRSITLNVNSGEAAEAPPPAAGNVGLPVVAEEKSRAKP